MANYQLQYEGSDIDAKLARMGTIISEFEALHAAFEALIGDNDETTVIDTLNEMKQFFANTQNTATVASVKQDAVNDAVEEIKSDIATVEDLDSIFS